jgi:serine/threonine-protein kinase RsbW
MRLAMTLSLPRHLASVTHARNVLTTLLSLTDTTDETRAQLAVLITEACANAVTHATGDSTIDLTITIDDHECILEVGNRGTTQHNAKITAELPDPLTIGGRGLPLIATLADTAAFTPAEPGHVLLRITKQLAQPTTPSDG